MTCSKSYRRFATAIPAPGRGATDLSIRHHLPHGTPPAWRRWSRPLACALILSLLALAALLPTAAPAASLDLTQLPPPAPHPVDFVRDIQPLFAKHCLACHGPTRQEADFRLDAKSIALSGGALGPAILPGKSAQSLLIHLVAGLIPDNRMPRKGDPLTPSQIALLRAWIDQGSPWPETASINVPNKRDHWAFKTPIRPGLPAVQNRSWPQNAIDHFILARMEQAHLTPAPPASKETLIRRLSLDLLGLPPTPAEIDAFLADQSHDAYDRLLERLLKSPHYGERWGRWWLDAARYADSNGYEKDANRSIWPYRDYVIRAFNQDLPFTQFTLEQLAGDLLPNPTLDQRVATGFLRNSMMNQEGGIEPEQFRIEALIDRMDALGRAWLGLTISCCQCHSHKYDPFSHKEYYQLLAFINNDDEPFLEVPTPAQEQQRKDILQKILNLESDALQKTPNLPDRLAAWESSLTNGTVDWTVLDPAEWHNFATKFTKLPDLSLLGGGDVKPYAVTHVWVDTLLTNITGFRLEALLHPNLPYQGPGLVAKGSFLLREFTAEAYAAHNPTVTNQIKFRRALADLEAPGFAITNAIDGNVEKGGWTASTSPVLRNTDHRAVFECAEPVPAFPGGTRIKFTLYQKHSNGDGHTEVPDTDSKLDCHAFGRFRLAATTQPAPLHVDPLSATQRQSLSLPPNKRSPDQSRDFFRIYRHHDPGLAKLNAAIEAVLTNWPYAPLTLALQEREVPRQTRLFTRGDWQRPGDTVQPATPSVLHPFPTNAPLNRLGLAQWLAHPDNPTTPRAVVNRVWQAFFGQGLVTTPEDFGTRVDAPSHPELLDWLAREFIQRDSSFKELHRLITRSATYRQSSTITPESLAVDPSNRLLSRGPRFRVEAETIQDIALAVSGLLNPKIGGPSVLPPLPANVGDTVYGGFTWPVSQNEDRYRRGLYTLWKRALPFPTLLSFDAPTAEAACVRRIRSNTPLQALTTLNEQTFVDAAQAMALRVCRYPDNDPAARATFAFRLATGRHPTPVELESILQFWNQQFRYFEDRTAEAVKVALRDPNQIPPEVNLHKVAAWAMVSRTLLNLDETITKE